jgi:hypothetical protein
MLSQIVGLIFDNVRISTDVLQVGEHLLSLVQELEAFAASDALPDLLRVQGEARSLTAQSAGWQALKALLEVPDVRATGLLAAVSLGCSSRSALDINCLQDQTLNGLCNKAKSTHPIGAIETTLLGPAAAAEALAEREQLALEDFEGEEDGDNAGVLAGSAAAGEEADLDNTAVLRFVNEWLSAVADAAVGLLLAQIARIETLSRAGAAQLVTDLEYLRYTG